MEKLLSEEELIKEITKLMHPVSYEIIYPETQSELGYPIAKNIVDLINTQKRLYAEIVIGEDETTREPSIKQFVLDRNSLRTEQRKKIK